MSTTNDTDLLRVVAEALVSRAKAAARPGGMDLTVQRDPPEFARKVLAAADLSVPPADRHHAPSTETLPERQISLLIGPWPVLIGDLGLHADQATESLRCYLNQAVIAWSHLGHRGEDMLLFLVGPQGSETDDGWQKVKRTIERDDRVCRKLVWLPPADAALHSASLDESLARTFLARPWSETITAEDGGDLAALTDEVLIEHFVNAGLTEAQAKDWFAILSADDEADLATLLVDALKDSPT